MMTIVSSRYPNVCFVNDVTFPEFVLKHLEEYGEKVALISPKTNQSYTFAEVIELSRRLAVGLHKKAGMRRGDVLSTCMGNHIELAPVMLGASMLGAVVNTANPAYTVRELIHQFSQCKSRFILTTSDLVEKIKSVKLQCKFIRVLITLDFRTDDCLYLPDLVADEDPDFCLPHIDPARDLAFLLNSSGTTGMPKAVMLTHQTMVANLCQVTQRYLEQPAAALFTPRVHDVVLSAFPWFHIGGIIVSGFWMLINGATCIIYDRYDPDDYIEAIRSYKVTILYTPPPVLVHYTKSASATAQDLATVKYIVCTGAVVSKEFTQAVVKKFNTEYFIQAYGMTELSPFCHLTPLAPLSTEKFGSCGVVLPATQCKVIDIETGQPLGPNTHGEVCIKGPQIMHGYLNNQTATNETIDTDGWLHTGDIGYYDHDEYFYIIDRIKDIIKVKAFQVSPAEIESILFTHPAIADAAVVGCPDDYAGEVPRAYVVLRPGKSTTAEDIKSYVAGQVVSYKRLEGGVVFLDEIPKTSSGKILRRHLRDHARDDIKSKL